MGDTTTSPARKRALLIGITRYLWSGSYLAPFDLRGPADDVRALAAVLQDGFGFASQDFMILLSEPGTPPEQLPTRANILLGLQMLIDATEPGDVALIYYSGHGAQWPDADGDEPSGFDSSIVPYDARDPANPAPPQGDIIDDALHNYLVRLQAKTENLTIIFDCCHSAGGTRADETPPGLAARELDYNKPLADGTPAPAAQAAQEIARQPRPPMRPRTALSDNPHFVFLAASRAEELAFEFTVGAADAIWPEEQATVGRSRGLFSFFLGRALRRGPTATYEDILTYLRDQVQTARGTQHPEGEGPLGRQLFGGSTRPVDWLPVTAFPAGGVLLGAGSAWGLAPGTGVQIYPDPEAGAEATLGQEPPVGTATVTRVFPLSAEATLDAPLARQPAHARALVIRPVYTGRQLRVAVRNAGVAAEDAAAVAEAIAGRAILQLVAPEASPAPDALAILEPPGIRFAVAARAPDGQPLPALAPLSLVADEDSIQNSKLKTQHSVLAEPAANQLARLAAFRDGLARANPETPLESRVTLRMLALDATPFPAGEPTFVPGAEYLLVLNYVPPPAGAGAPLYFTLFRFAADGSVTQWYPPEGAQEKLRPGQQWPPPGGEDYFRWPAQRAAPIPGAAPGPVRDWLKLFVSTAPLDLRALQQPPIPVAPTRSEEIVPGARGRARPYLPDAATGDWTSLTLSYLIR